MMVCRSIDSMSVLLQEASEKIVILENLDQKIHEALDHEMEFNFALTPMGDRIGWSVLRPGERKGREHRWVHGEDVYMQL